MQKITRYVIEMSAYQAYSKRTKVSKQLKLLSKIITKDHAEMFKNELEKLEARHKKLLEELKRHSEGNSSPSDALNVIAEDESEMIFLCVVDVWRGA